MDSTAATQIHPSLDEQHQILATILERQIDNAYLDKTIERIKHFISKPSTTLHNEILQRLDISFHQQQKQIDYLELQLSQFPEKHSFDWLLISTLLSVFMLLLIVGFMYRSTQGTHSLISQIDNRNPFRQKIDHNVQSIALLNTNLMLIEANASFYQLTDIDRNLAKNLTIKTWIPKEEYSKLDIFFKNLEQTSKTISTKIIRPDGLLQTVQIHAYVDCIEKEDIYFLVVEKISDKRLFEQRMQAQLRQNLTFYAELNFDQKFVNLSDPEIFGFDQSQITYSIFLLQFPEDQRLLIMEEVERIVANIENDKTIHTTIRTIDTEAKKLYLSLQKLNDQVLSIYATKIPQHTQNLLDSLSSTTQLQSKVFTQISHKIHPHLKNVIGLSELLNQQTNPDKNVAKIHESAQEIFQTFNDLNALLSTPKNNVTNKIDVFDLDILIQESMQKFAALASSKSITLDLRIEPTLPISFKGNAKKIQQIVENLIRTCIQQISNERLTVSLYLLSRQSNQVQIECSIDSVSLMFSQSIIEALHSKDNDFDLQTLDECSNFIELMAAKALVLSLDAYLRVRQMEQKHTLLFNLNLSYIDRLEMDEEQSSNLKGQRYGVISKDPSMTIYLATLLTHWKMIPEIIHESYISNLGAISQNWSGVIIDDTLDSDKKEHYKAFLEETPDLIAIILESTLREENEPSYGKILNFPFTPSELYRTIFGHNISRYRLDPQSQQEITLTHPNSALIVEDEHASQIIMSTLLKKMGFETDIVSNGERAIEHIKSKHFSIVFMDIHLPTIDGFTTSKEIRKYDHQIPIIGLSSSPQFLIKSRAKDVNMSFYIEKPIDIQKLNMVVAQYFDITTSESKTPIPQKRRYQFDQIDLEALIFSLDLQEELAYQLIYEFTQNLKADLPILQTYASDNMRLILEQIHRIKGTSANLKITDIYETCLQLELFQNQPQKFEQTLENFFILSQKLISDVETRMHFSTSNKQADGPELLTLIDQLIDQIEQHKLIKKSDIETLTEVRGIDGAELIEIFQSHNFKQLKSWLLSLKQSLNHFDD
jgi:CheY-like chemotaxis protein/signal transduction histidine kinase